MTLFWGSRLLLRVTEDGKAVREICDLNLENYHYAHEEPSEPRRSIRAEIIGPSGLSATAAAAALHGSPPALSSC